MSGKTGRTWSPTLLKIALALFAICISGYIIGPPLYWRFLESFAAITYSSSSSPSCPPCICDCSSQPILSIPEGLRNTSFSGCVGRDPGVSEETERGFVELLTEELSLREADATDSQKRADLALLEAKKMASQYQKEADKCNSGMETCEEAREKAESALSAQKKLSELWESRARRRGWTDDQPHQNV